MSNANWLRSVLVVLALTTSLDACAVMSGRETAGEYVDDATITTKVKAAMFDDPSLKVMQIGVETMQNVVQLSGFVDSRKPRPGPESLPAASQAFGRSGTTSSFAKEDAGDRTCA